MEERLRQEEEVRKEVEGVREEVVVGW